MTWSPWHGLYNLIPPWWSLCNMILMTQSSLCSLSELVPTMWSLQCRSIVVPTVKVQPPWHNILSPGLYDDASHKVVPITCLSWPGLHSVSYDAFPIVKPLWSSPYYTAPLTQPPWPGPHDLAPKCKVLTTQFFWHKLYTMVLKTWSPQPSCFTFSMTCSWRHSLHNVVLMTGSWRYRSHDVPLYDLVLTM